MMSLQISCMYFLEWFPCVKMWVLKEGGNYMYSRMGCTVNREISLLNIFIGLDVS